MKQEIQAHSPAGDQRLFSASERTLRILPEAIYPQGKYSCTKE
ncbi:MAG: hypothetical protein RBR04_01900 [Candidatus Syntrophosphaera sp.]|nr:hypothetical protein [Candidatus Syntrophosphaera sp.]